MQRCYDSDLRALQKFLVLPALVIAMTSTEMQALAKPKHKSKKASPQAPKQVKPTAVRPWAKGVSEADQEEATRLFEEGNQLFANKAYDEARKLYLRALKHWKHPAAQFNLAECLILLGQPVEAYEQLKGSMRFGAEPLGEAMLQRAEVRKQLLEGQLATLSVKNPEEGAKVTLNGELLFNGVNQMTRIVKPGRFQIVATKAGYVTQTTTLTLLPATTESIKISLRRPSSLDVEFARRWSAWKPWAVVGGAVAVGATGGFLYSKSVSTMEKYDQQIATQCPNGCEPGALPGSTRNLKDRAELYNTISFVAAGTAGAVLATGVILVYMNQLHPQTESNVSVAAVPTTDGGAQATLSYEF
jgi:tetratricopeptide (TPR) repeat protein